MTPTRRDVFELACRAFEAEMWPEGPAHGSGSGIWAAHKPRLAALLALDGRSQEVVDDLDRLAAEARETIAFLRSVVVSAETLSPRSHDRIDAILERLSRAAARGDDLDRAWRVPDGTREFVAFAVEYLRLHGPSVAATVAAGDRILAALTP